MTTGPNPQPGGETPPGTPPASDPPAPPAPTPPAPPAPSGGTPPPSGPSPEQVQAQIDAARREEAAKWEALASAAEEERRKQTETEQQRIERERDEARAQLAERDAAIAKRDHDDRVKRLLIQSSVPLQTVDRARLLVTSPANATDAEVLAEIEEIRKDVPLIFATAEGAPPPPGVPPVTPPPGGGNQPASGVEKGRERARREAEARKAHDPLARFQRVGA